MRRKKLLVVELWGLGDLALATTFLRAASTCFDVTLLAKPFAEDLRARLWPDVRIAPFTAPWTVFRGKYDLRTWPWRELWAVRSQLVAAHFDVGVSARWDPRDAAVLAAVGCRQRIGFQRRGSGLLLTTVPPHPNTWLHRHAEWQRIARTLGFELPAATNIAITRPAKSDAVLVHVGSSHQVRVWDLKKYCSVISGLRSQGRKVIVACDDSQAAELEQLGEHPVVTRSVSSLLELIDRSGAFVGNDSGPGHLAAACGVPTFTVFGNNVPELFLPAHPDAQYVDGKPCAFKPCWDQCRFDEPVCITRLSERDVWPRVSAFVAQRLGDAA